MDERQPADDIAAQGAPASPDALRAIVARHQRTRTRTLGVALAVALVAGPVAGWAIGHGGGGGTQVATGSNGGTPTAANAPAGAGAISDGASSSAIAYPGGTPPKTTHLFSRTTADGITIRAYRTDPPPPPPTPTTATPPPKGQATPPPKGQATVCPKPMPATSGEAGASSGGATAPEPPPTAINGAPPPATAINGAAPQCAPDLPPVCKSGPSVQTEVSNDAAVGQSFDPIDDKQPSAPLNHVQGSMFGVAEGSAAVFVTVQTGPGVATVRLRLPSGATDEMAPIGNVAVLAHASGGSPPPTGTVEALDSSGKVLASQDLTQPGPKTAFACGFAVGSGTVRAYQAPLPAPATAPTTR